MEESENTNLLTFKQVWPEELSQEILNNYPKGLLFGSNSKDIHGISLNDMITNKRHDLGKIWVGSDNKIYGADSYEVRNWLQNNGYPLTKDNERLFEVSEDTLNRNNESNSRFEQNARDAGERANMYGNAVPALMGASAAIAPVIASGFMAPTLGAGLLAATKTGAELGTAIVGGHLSKNLADNLTYFGTDGKYNTFGLYVTSPLLPYTVTDLSPVGNMIAEAPGMLAGGYNARNFGAHSPTNNRIYSFTVVNPLELKRSLLPKSLLSGEMAPVLLGRAGNLHIPELLKDKITIPNFYDGGGKWYHPMKGTGISGPIEHHSVAKYNKRVLAYQKRIMEIKKDLAKASGVNYIHYLNENLKRLTKELAELEQGGPEKWAQKTFELARVPIEAWENRIKVDPSNISLGVTLKLDGNPEAPIVYDWTYLPDKWKVQPSGNLLIPDYMDQSQETIISTIMDRYGSRPYYDLYGILIDEFGTPVHQGFYRMSKPTIYTGEKWLPGWGTGQVPMSKLQPFSSTNEVTNYFRSQGHPLIDIGPVNDSWQFTKHLNLYFDKTGKKIEDVYGLHSLIYAKPKFYPQ